MNLKKVWKLVLENIQITLSEGSFNTWIKPLALEAIHKDEQTIRVVIACPTAYHRNFIEKRYFTQIQDALISVLSDSPEISFVVSEAVSRDNQGSNAGPLFAAFEEKKQQLHMRLHQLGLREDYTFDTFAVSSSNEVAHAAAQAVVENMGQSYNPLFLYGDVGVGKTHIMQAIAIEAIKKRPDFKALYCAGEQFTNEIIEAIHQKNTSQFRQRYRKVQGLFIDDIQFIAGKNTVQEEFFHTFNAIQQAGGQVVMTSDRPPSDIKALEDRLRSRFEAGLIVDIGEPSFELRSAIVLIKAQQRSIKIDMEQAQLIAANIESARAIEGFLVRVQSESQLRNQPITLAMIQGLMGKPSQMGSNQPPPKRPSEIIKEVASYFNVTAKQVKSKSRMRNLVTPRHIAMYLMRVDYNLGFEEIGGFFSNRDHTTVMHAVDKITQNLKDSEGMRIDVGQIRDQVYTY